MKIPVKRVFEIKNPPNLIDLKVNHFIYGFGVNQQMKFQLRWWRGQMDIKQFAGTFKGKRIYV